MCKNKQRKNTKDNYKHKHIQIFNWFLVIFFNFHKNILFSSLESIKIFITASKFICLFVFALLLYIGLQRLVAQFINAQLKTWHLQLQGSSKKEAPSSIIIWLALKSLC